MNKKIGILLVICFSPPFIFLGYFFFRGVFSNESLKQVFLEHVKDEQFCFKIESIYRDQRNHNTLTMKGENKDEIATSVAVWENYFKVNDSIVKEKGLLQIYIYRNNKLDTVLDYNSVYKHR